MLPSGAFSKNQMRLVGFEPPTPALGEPRSIQVSYRRKLPLNLFTGRFAPFWFPPFNLEKPKGATYLNIFSKNHLQVPGFIPAA
jgi:hypothetical protein